MIGWALLRHGSVIGGVCFRGSTDDALTAEGWQQMWDSVQGQPRWDRIVSSPLQRCASFARELAKRSAIPYTLDARLREIHFGAWEGRTTANVHAATPDALQRFWTDPTTFTPPEAESLLAFQTRVLACWQRLQQSHEGQRLLIVTHGGVIRVLLCHLLEHPLARLQEFPVAHGALLRLPIANPPGAHDAPIL